MIHFLLHGEIDKKKWDEAVALSSSPLCCAQSWWLDIVSPQWKALAAEDYSQIFPLTCREKLLMPYLVQPLFSQQLGLFSAAPGQPADEVISQAARRYFYININLNTANHLEKYTGIQLPNFVLDLDSKYRYSDNCRRAIKLATESGLSIQEDVPVEMIMKLFSTDRGKKVKLHRRYYEVLKNLVNGARLRNQCKSWGVMFNGELVCGAIFILYQDTSTFLFSGNSALGKEKRAMFYLVEQFISRRFTRFFDFEGSRDEGIARFYKGFGAENRPYINFKKLF